MLDVDVDLQHPSLITLEEVEALSLLEPYGAGNNRPVFCLRGATLESVQGVGQNRHLKLKLQKSRVNCRRSCGTSPYPTRRRGGS